MPPVIWEGVRAFEVTAGHGGSVAYTPVLLSPPTPIPHPTDRWGRNGALQVHRRLKKGGVGAIRGSTPSELSLGSRVGVFGTLFKGSVARLQRHCLLSS